VKRRFGLSGQDEHPADSGDQAYDDEGPRIQRTPVFNRNGDRVKQLGYDEQQKGLVEDCEHGRWQVVWTSQDDCDLPHGVDDQRDSQCREEYRYDYVNSVFHKCGGTNDTCQVPAGTDRQS